MATELLTAELVSRIRGKLLSFWIGERAEVEARQLLTEAADEIEHLRALLAQWEANCTGRHGSQMPCGLNADHRVPSTRPAKHDPKCKPDFPFHLCPVCYPGL
jgi:hypothetical protein